MKATNNILYLKDKKLKGFSKIIFYIPYSIIIVNKRLQVVSNHW